MMRRREFLGACSIVLGLSAFPWSAFSAEHVLTPVPQWERLPLTTKRMRQLGVDGGDGFQYVHALAYAPSNPAFVYLSVDQSGVWRSDDGGGHWEPKFKGFYAYGARSIAVDPLNPLVVLAAGFLGFNARDAAKYPNRYQGIFLTIDGGESWRMVRRTDFYKQAAKGSLFAFAATVGDEKHKRCSLVWCATAREGLLRSENGGESWVKTDFKEADIHALAQLQDGSKTMLMASPRGLWSYSDSGVEEIGQGLSTFPRSIAVSRAEPQQVQVALGLDGVAISNDGGRTFSPSVKQFSFPLLPMDVTDIAVSPVDANRLYLRANLVGQPPFSSADGGNTWDRPQAVDPEGLLDKPGFYFSSPFAPHPIDPKTCLHVTNGRARIIRTTDGGETWRFSGSGFSGARMADILFPDSDTMIFCLTDHGMWLTRDGGQSFSEISTPRVHDAKSVSAAAVRGEHIVAGFGAWGKKGLLVSHNAGKSFQALPELEDQYSFVAFHPEIPGRVYAGQYTSEDFGKTWHRLPKIVRAMSPDGTVLYAVASNGKASSVLMASLDGGFSFTSKAVLGFPVQAINQVIATEKDTLLLATTRGIFRFEQGRGELRDYRHGLNKDFFGTMHVSAIASDPNNPDRVYAGRRALGYGNGNGVFMSSDNGRSWQDMNLNLAPGITVFAIKICPFSGSVYLGTSFGTFRLDAAAHT